MTRGFDSFAWVDRMPGFPSSGTVVQGTVVTVEDSNFSDFPDIPRLPDSSEGRQQSQRRSSAQTHDHGGLEPAWVRFRGFSGRLTPRGGRSGRPGPCLPADFWHSRAGTLRAVSSVQA